MRRWILPFALMLLPVQAVAAEAEPAFPVPGGSVAASPEGPYRYASPPTVATAPAGSACETAARYMETANRAAWDEMSSLFAEDAIFGTPSGAGGRYIRGREAIHRFYSDRVRNMTQHALLIPMRYSAVGPDCYVTIALTTDSTTYSLGMIEHFTVSADGKIGELIAYMR